MAEQMQQQNRDLVLPPGQYAYVLDNTKGNVSLYVGPKTATMRPEDRLVIWSGKKFVVTNDFNQAIQPFIKAAEGQYIVLTDPAADSQAFPKPQSVNDAIELDVGKRIVISGPATFPLWPGQTAQVIDGHHLNLNQYLIAQVYEPEAAQANMDQQIAAPQVDVPDGEHKAKPKAPTARQFTMGERIVIEGTQVSFYVPPTGIEVVQDEPEMSNKLRAGGFVREAATLEQLEYCVLIDENGSKRYERGPKVVFPKPTETFVTERTERKFRAIELNDQSGLYIKVIADYTGDDGKKHEEGEELFITGKETPIYFPRAEESVIHYGEQRKHYAVAIPKGEGRYVLNRTTGEVSLIEGPAMFLPDPRTQVIVRRVLDSDDCEMMYPGNTEAQAVNAKWRSELFEAGDEFLPVVAAANVGVGSLGEAGSLAKSYQATSTFAGERVRRSTQYTPPRTITLDTKYQGAVSIEVWPGYAVLVMDKSGNRRIVNGPQSVLLAYDEKLMPLSLSRGRPKTDQAPLRTVYLRTLNNAVSDRVVVETKDLVKLQVDLKLRANFEGEDQTKWFDVEDYIKLLTDHCRSKLRNLSKRHDFIEFYNNTIDLIRDELLGKAKRASVLASRLT